MSRYRTVMMWLEKIIVCYFCLFTFNVASSNFKIYDSSATNPSTRLTSHARELVDMCLTNNSNSVIITEDLYRNGYRDENPSDENDKISSVIIITSDFEPSKIAELIRSWPTYVLPFESIEKLEALIEKLRSSTIWSVTSKFLILDTTKEPRCANAGKILGFLWKIDLLFSYYMCYDNDRDSTFIYTLNPFTDYAPPPWVQVEATDECRDEENEKSTLYSLQYSKDAEVCENITFDKTKYLDGHKIKFSTFARVPNNTNEKIIKQKKELYIQNSMKNKYINLYTSSPYINATPTIDYISTSNQAESIKKGYITELADNKYDVYDRLLQLADVNYKYTDVITRYSEAKYSILTQKTNYSTAMSELTLNLQLLALTVVVLVLITLVIVINNRFNISGAILDVVRLSAGMGIMTPLDRLSMRIIYFVGFLFIFLVMPEVQGHISATLSNPTSPRNMETLADLYNNKYHVYYNRILHNDIVNEKLWITDEDQKYLHPSDQSYVRNCTLLARRNSTTACIFFTSIQVNSALKLKNLHVSKDAVFKKYLVFWTRKHWALKDKLDKAGLKPREMGFLNYYEDKWINRISKKLKRKNKIKENQRYDQIDWENWIFYFIIMSVTLLWGLFIFGMEILVHKYNEFYRQFQMLKKFGRKKKSLRSLPRTVFFSGRRDFSTAASYFEITEC
ncbi:uncharacterized protein LOC130673574 isoform X2 [Microplitis mediator]|uniref:uncharacterized protein LOC130673574 isoform X2 n=1 Tax=Microplitis mediator TaxID=375433 RepID=UPI00255551AA|nr:uncharacterized protein LOC130673574 isoform X2 [Microplitis mediator]